MPMVTQSTDRCILPGHDGSAGPHDALLGGDDELTYAGGITGTGVDAISGPGRG